MLFLLNDVVFNLDGVRLAPRLAGRRMRALSFEAVIQLGRELYARHPLLHYDCPDRAQRLAVLCAAKAPQVNAALFVAPSFECEVDEVSVSYANLQFEVMAGLYQRQKAGALDIIEADRQVWRRLAA